MTTKGSVVRSVHNGQTLVVAADQIGEYLWVVEPSSPDRPFTVMVEDVVEKGPYKNGTVLSYPGKISAVGVKQNGKWYVYQGGTTEEPFDTDAEVISRLKDGNGEVQELLVPNDDYL